MAKHINQGGCENFDGEPHTLAECRRMAARIMRVENAVRDDAENITDGGSLTVFTS